jgi:hypothetical protein
MFSYLKSRLEPIVDRVSNSPTTEYVKEKVSVANGKVRTFIDQRIRKRVGDDGEAGTGDKIEDGQRRHREHYSD